MRRIMLCSTAMVFAAIAVPAVPAEANVCAKAYAQRAAVIKKFGKRAPGRNICRYGVKHSNGKVVEATFKQKKRYLNQLRALVRPAPSMLVRTSVPPAQRPAGVQTASVTAGGTLQAIAQCESGGNPRAVSQNGLYTGKYQFDDATWRSVGGSGRAGNASESEQDMRAARLYSQRGPRPWPVCGR